MSCAAKILMGILNERLFNWVEFNSINDGVPSGLQKKLFNGGQYIIFQQ